MRRLRYFPIALLAVSSLIAQVKILDPDAPSCADSKLLPKLPGCRVDACEKKESDRREAPIRESEGGGDPLTMALEGDSRSVMYECNAGIDPATTIRRAAVLLQAAPFEILYQYSGQEGTLTARKGDTWLLLEAASNFYTLTELTVPPPDPSVITDAAGLAETIERFGRVTVNGIRFLAGRPETTMDSEAALREVAIMLTDHPEWKVRIECFTDNTGLKAANVALSNRRATGVVAWLSGRGVKRLRMEPLGKGDAQPIADNSTPAGRARNSRLEVVKVD
ncbi:MAG TPA: OmpA family protein [Bryobacteraceae bacterium]|nr:OmpA family protein [Bryobacteraceae bacterium]